MIGIDVTENKLHNVPWLFYDIVNYKKELIEFESCVECRREQNRNIDWSGIQQ
jgi:hypothetical protein